MPHECTDCGAVYEDGSTQMLDGCDGCGGTTFIFTKGASASGDAPAPSGADPDAGDTAGEPDAPAGAPGAEGNGEAPAEDAAQSSARSDIVEAEDVEADGTDGDGDAASEEATGPTDDPSASTGDPSEGELPTPDADEVREELMAQFESIKIVEPGSYELNLMNLYDRDEKIIALQEDGRYQVSLPSAIED